MASVDEVVDVETIDEDITEETNDAKEHGDAKEEKFLTPQQKKQLEARRKKQRQKLKKKKLAEQLREALLNKEKLPKDIEIAVDMATKLFHQIVEYKKANPDFMELPDEKKFEKIKEWKEFNGFSELHPIVSKYMCCNFMYDAGAFRSHLKKVAMEPINPSDHKSKRAKQEKWAEHQAFYVQTLFKSIHTKNKTPQKPQYYQVVWQDTYKSIMGDFDDFNDTYAEVERREKEQEKQSKAELAEEFYGRAVTGVQLVPKEHLLDMFRELRDAMRRQDVKEEPPTSDTPTDTTPTITMIEHVSEETYNTVDDKYKAPLPKDNIASVLLENS